MWLGMHWCDCAFESIGMQINVQFTVSVSGSSCIWSGVHLIVQSNLLEFQFMCRCSWCCNCTCHMCGSQQYGSQCTGADILNSILYSQHILIQYMEPTWCYQIWFWASTIRCSQVNMLEHTVIAMHVMDALSEPIKHVCWQWDILCVCKPHIIAICIGSAIGKWNTHKHTQCRHCVWFAL